MIYKTKILIVEDEPQVANSIKLSLEEKGYTVVNILSTGEAALEYVDNNNVDLVLMDIVLESEMSGTEAAILIRKNFNIPIIFLTAFCNDFMIERAKLSQPFGYILKPFNDRELYATIEIALFKSNIEQKQNILHLLFNIYKNVSRLIIREKEKQKLLKQICDIFIQNSSYSSAFIIELNEAKKIINFAGSNLEKEFSSNLEKLKKSIPPEWLNKTLKDKTSIINASLIFPQLTKNQIIIFARLESEQKIYGIIAVLLDERRVDSEELKLLENIASEIGFALKNLSLESKENILKSPFADILLKYKQVVDNAAELIFICDLNKKFTYINKSCILNLGYTLEELLNSDCLNLVPVEFHEQLNAFYEKLLETKQAPSYIEYPIKTKNNILRWYGQNVNLVYEDQSIVGFYCISRDITERKKIENDLYESEKRYRQIVEMSPEAILIYSKGKIIFTNKAGIRLFGAEDEGELLGKSVTELFYPNSIDVSKARAKYITKDDTLLPLRELQIKRFNGTTVNVELTTNNIIFHGQKAVQVVLRDISERKHVEEELRNRQHEVTTLLDSLPAYAFFKDVNYRYITANQRFCNAIGYTKEAIVGKTDFDFFPKSFAEKFQKDDEKVITTGESIFIYEEQMIDQGKPITVDTRKVPLKDQYGKIVGLIGLAFDITERKTAEEAIKKYTKELEELNANKDKFFSIISHDLRSPFQGLLGLSNILAEEFDNLSLDEIRLFSSNIHNSTKNLFSLLENLLQWSRIQTGKLELKPVKTDLQEEILYNINLLKGNASKKNIEIINEITKSVFVYTDLNVLNSTLQNLISNAIKFTNPGGTITISMKTSEDFIELTVSDNGVGISKDNIEKLFRIDKQFTTPGTERESGTGLGLTICKELLEKQGCKIWVTSELGKGSNFSFTIPKFQE